MILKVISILLSLFALTSYKYLPGSYTLRFGYISIKYLYFKNIKKSSNLLSIPLTRKSYCAPLECDFFGLHKNNSTYFTELDLARTETVLNSLHTYFRNKILNNENYAFVPLATITNHFLKEIKPFQNYSIESKIVAFNDNSLLIMSLFLISNSSNNTNFIYKSNRVTTISIARLVFKNGRKTVPPIEIIKESNVLVKDQDNHHKNYENFILAQNDPNQLLTLYSNL